MHIFPRRFAIAFFGLFLAAGLLYCVPAVAHAQASDHFSIHSQELSSASGVCKSDTHTLRFSVGQASVIGTSQSDSQRIFAGFISSTTKLAVADDGSSDESSSDDSPEQDTSDDGQEYDVSDEASSPDGSSDGGSCFISTLFE